MHYIILVIGLLIGLYALYRFFLNASITQIKAFLLTSITIVVGIAIFTMAITGRLPAALALSGALIPLGGGFLKMFREGKATAAEGKLRSDGPMTRKDAFEILGLKDGASEDDIKATYKSLMKKLHPDNEGSEWMATKLNQAKDFLLKS